MYQMVDRAVGHLAHTFLNTKKTPKLMEFHDLTQKIGVTQQFSLEMERCWTPQKYAGECHPK